MSDRRQRLRETSKPLVGISLGCPCGIGPEIVIKALRDARVKRSLRPVVFGDASFAEKLPHLIPVTALPKRALRPGKPNRAAGAAQLKYLEWLTQETLAGRLQAICTAPVSKEAIARSGKPFVGHTEFLAQAFGRDVLMLMDSPKLKVALATNHLAVREVPRAIGPDRIRRQLSLLHQHFQGRLHRQPRIAMLGLNPHAGDGGLFGDEERRVLIPALAAAKRRGINAHGPFSADGYFSRWASMPYDVVLAMYHDQALPLVKALDFRHTVNVTVGLPFPRTSPDHGVAYDIAGQGVADEEPMVQALIKAAELV